ncbi:hypothetical protein SRABI84_05259 [Peribacillus simplex]|uniref:hypothetical protein n=1 Tax=Peribacillus simplex TaxID=1478 RepID=UPI001DB4F0E0|nr:hypothetical protein [Peribacillus simplex]CAH0320882.1 hypothetical protein SRABI84_05259 [Peribacillus simplex]
MKKVINLVAAIIENEEHEILYALRSPLKNKLLLVLGNLRSDRTSIRLASKPKLSGVFKAVVL